MRPIFAALALAAALPLPVCAADLRFPEDAALHAVQFVDGNEGWAVGDDGAIWHSIDGGKSWERQPTAVRASLQALHFLTPYTGWVVGREELPHGGGSAGVVLVTRDGGLKWQRLAVNALPGLHCVHFFDDKSGVVAGDGTDQFPTGLFATDDGGRTWKHVPGPRCPGWRAADFQNLQTGALAGAWSRLATVREGSFGAADADLDGRSVLGLQVQGSRAVAVGEGGLVLLSASTAGVRWGFADLRLPTEVLSCLEFHAVACRGEHTWVAGRPGSVILHSPDRGQTWELQRTGQNLPIHGLCFLDTQLGWAVGELGTVLVTHDGGKTWEAQRHGGQRAAVLCIHARPTSVPLDTVALLGGQEGYLTAALSVMGPDPASAAHSHAAGPQKLAAAMRQVAGAAGECLWQFPVPEHLSRADKKEILAAWDKLHGDQAAEQLLRQLVLAIRIWQPEVILTDARTEGIAEDLIGEAMQAAFQRAADPKAFAEQIDKLGLQPWSVKKLYGRCSQEMKANQVFVDLMEIQPRLEATPRDFAQPGAALLQDTSPAPATRAIYWLLDSRLADAKGHRRLMDGIVLEYGGKARRKLEEESKPDAEILKAVRMRRNLQTLSETPLAGLTDPDRLLGEIGPLLKNLPDDQGAAAALAMANQFAQAGQWNLAREAYLLMVDRYPAHPASVDAYRWLIRHNSSSEARRRQELGQFLVLTKATVQQGPRDTPNSPFHGGSEAVTMRQVTMLSDLVQARHWYEGCLSIEPRLLGFGAIFANDPSVQFALNSARRNLGKFDEAHDWYKRFLRDHPEGPWHDAAAAELWLVNRQGPPPKPAASCRQTPTRPFLDGKFDDECWRAAKALKFRNAVGKTLREKARGVVDEAGEQEYGTEARFAYDKDFLYVAVRCKHPTDRYVAPVPRRKRDEDLQAYDRISLLLDLDRDYNTCFHLEVDQRGCVYEDCWGDKSWNPKWFVAVRSEPTCWQAELAIPLIEMTGEAVTPGRAWACNVSRILPGRGVQAWSLPADVKPRPEGMGLLLFLQDPQHTATAEANLPVPPTMPPAKP
jgi:photosystem II stability/assembly factor-like uncharacterized protein/tetratricopeptide (TPR) repeat protein